MRQVTRYTAKFKENILAYPYISRVFKKYFPEAKECKDSIECYTTFYETEDGQMITKFIPLILTSRSEVEKYKIEYIFKMIDVKDMKLDQTHYENFYKNPNEWWVYNYDKKRLSSHTHIIIKFDKINPDNNMDMMLFCFDDTNDKKNVAVYVKDCLIVSKDQFLGNILECLFNFKVYNLASGKEYSLSVIQNTKN